MTGSKESSKRVERNAIENLNGSVAAYTHNAKCWRGGWMMLRWVGAAVLEARKEFRRVKGFRAMPKLVKALEQHDVDQGLHDNAKAAQDLSTWSRRSRRINSKRDNPLKKRSKS